MAARARRPFLQGSLKVQRQTPWVFPRSRLACFSWHGFGIRGNALAGSTVAAIWGRTRGTGHVVTRSRKILPWGRRYGARSQ